MPFPRQVLSNLNEMGDNGLKLRREVLKRVAGFDSFSSCYPDNQLKAKGAVAS
jgi:restriction system protein